MITFPYIKDKFCEWSGSNPDNVSWGIPGGVNDNTQAVRLSFADGDYIVAHDFDRKTREEFIEVTEFFSNEDIANMRKEYTQCSK